MLIPYTKEICIKLSFNMFVHLYSYLNIEDEDRLNSPFLQLCPEISNFTFESTHESNINHKKTCAVHEM